MVPFQQVTEVQDRRLVRHRLAAKVNANKAAHRNRLIQRLLRRRIRQIEPLLQKVQPQIDAAARDALKQWRFEPPTRDGKPVAAYMIMTTVYRIE